MPGRYLDHRRLWQYSHSASILTAVLLFTAGFLCVLLWTNNIVHTPTSSTSSGALTNTFTSISPPVSTFSITYNVAIFGTAWNAIFFVTLLVLERNALPITSLVLRYEIEKAACIVSVAGNAIYSVACLALMATLARLASDANPVAPENATAIEQDIASSAFDRRAGQGTTAAMAGFAAVAAVWACAMDVLQAQKSEHRRVVKEELMSGRPSSKDA